MAKTGRNDPCPCGSGKKFKRCHEVKQQSGLGSRVMLIVIACAMLAAVVIGIVSYSSSDPTAGVRIWSTEHGHYHDANGRQVP
jgi:hypothetical protein